MTAVPSPATGGRMVTCGFRASRSAPLTLLSDSIVRAEVDARLRKKPFRNCSPRSKHRPSMVKPLPLP